MDITAGKHGNNPESMAAHRSILGHKELMRGVVYEAIKTRGAEGSTCDEVSARLDIGIQSVSGRFTELKALGKIIDTGLRRPTRSGRAAAVYVSK